MVAIADQSTTEQPDAHAMIEKWRRLLLRFAAQYGRCYRIEIDEAYQWIVLYILTHWDSWTATRGAFSTWLHLVIPSAFREIKSQAMIHSVPCMSLSIRVNGHDEHGIELGDLQPDPRSVEVTDLVDDRMRREEVWRAVASLSPDEQAVIVKRFELDAPLTQSDRRTLESALSTLSDVLTPPC